MGLDGLEIILFENENQLFDVNCTHCKKPIEFKWGWHGDMSKNTEDTGDKYKVYAVFVDNIFKCAYHKKCLHHK